MEIELFLNDLCPYCQRVTIVARHLGIAHQATPINLGNRPEWLAEISPQSTVPAMRFGTTAIFDSSVINEFLNDRAGGTMLPSDPLARALCRAWINHAGHCQTQFTQCCLAANENGFEIAKETLLEALEKFEHGPLSRAAEGFNGPTLSLVDAAMAPLFTRIAHVGAQLPILPEEGLERIRTWSDRLLHEPAVLASIPEKFSLMFKMFLKNRAAGGPVAARMLVETA
ncbi:MAG: glutathione S-transferase family protein [Magnetococcus sp. YQC-9]